MKSFKYKVFPK